MNGRVLALASIAGLAAMSTGRTRLAGSPARRLRPGSFRRVPVPGGFTLSPLSLVRHSELENVLRGQADPDVNTGFFHVTTNLLAVLAERDPEHPLGRLWSRRELGARGRASTGLGGGHRDLAADRVSAGVTLLGAFRVLDGMRLMARAVHQEIAPRLAMQQMLGLTAETRRLLLIAAGEWGMPDMEHWSDSELQKYQGEDEWDGDESYEDEAFGAACRFHLRSRDLERDVLSAWTDADAAGLDRGHVLYARLTEYEGMLARTRDAWTRDERMEDVACSAPVGFLEPAERFARNRVENMGLLQLACRENLAHVEFMESECELRFRSEDVRVVGVWMDA